MPPGASKRVAEEPRSLTSSITCTHAARCEYAGTFVCVIPVAISLFVAEHDYSVMIDVGEVATKALKCRSCSDTLIDGAGSTFGIPPK